MWVWVLVLEDVVFSGVWVVVLLGIEGKVKFPRGGGWWEYHVTINEILPPLGITFIPFSSRYIVSQY